MAHEILMPKLGLTMTEGTVEEWKFKEGDTVKKGDILLSVATDKLTNDVESEVDGVLLKILLPEGESAPCKAVIAYVVSRGKSFQNIHLPQKKPRHNRLLPHPRRRLLRLLRVPQALRF